MYKASLRGLVRATEIAFALYLPELLRLVLSLPVPTESAHWFWLGLEGPAVITVLWLAFHVDDIKDRDRSVLERQFLRTCITLLSTIMIYFLVSGAVIARYTPPSGGKEVDLLVPAHLTTKGDLYYVFGRCEQPRTQPCKPSQWDTAYSAREIAQQMEIHGEAGLMIEPGVWTLLWSASLVVLYGALVWQLVYLFGIIGIRLVDKRLSQAVRPT